MLMIPELFAIFIFIIATVFGLINVLQMFGRQPPSLLIMCCHCLAGLIGLGLLYVQVYNGGYGPLLLWSTGLFTVAGVLDGVVLTLYLCHRRLSNILAALHTLIGVAGLIVLIIYVLMRGQA